jgi:serine phosphatase RsbU (regulator of sigma subunit)
MKSKHFGWAIAGLGLLLLLYTLVFYVQEAVRLRGWLVSGGNATEIRFEGADSVLVMRRIESKDFPDAVLPADGDTLISFVTAAGDTLDRAGITAFIAKPGERARLTVRHAGAPLTTSFLYHPRTAGEIAWVFTLDITRVLITFGFLLVGLWAVTRRPDQAGVRALAMFSFAMSSLMLGAVNLGFARMPAFAIPGQKYVDFLLTGLVLSFGTFWLNLQLYFPTALDWVRRHTLRAHLLLYGPQVIALVLTFTEWLRSGFLISALISVYTFGGFLALILRKRAAKEPLVKRQLSLVIWGSGMGLGLLFVLVVLGATGLMGKLPELASVALVQLAFMALLLSPISFAYAFGRYRLLEVEGRLRRGTRYLLVTGVLLALFFVLLYGISSLLLGGLKLDGRSPTLAVALILALGITPLHRRAQSAFAQRIYPEQRRLRDILDEFHASAATLADRGSLFARLEQSLREGMGITALVPAMADAKGERLLLPGNEALLFDERGQLMRALRLRREPLLVDELRASGRVVLDDAEDAWLATRRIGVILPLSLRSQLQGLLFLVCDRNWEGLSVAGLEELRNLGSQVALETENLRLIEETLDRRRLQEQLDMARRVQEGFLPRSLPKTPGLELAACFQSSLEVAGDYYDVLALPGNRTLLAVGDVSGKGAGAAMIMANLQASLRSMARVGVPLGEMVGGINDIIHANTRVEQFITFFAAIYEPATRELRFVNAGHNPPRVIHADGSASALDPVGPILGVFPGLTFAEQSVAMAPGDLLIAFTDGVSEAMNAADEDFSEERIVTVAVPLRGGPPAPVLAAIEAAVTAFRGERDLLDDYTLLVARVTDTDRQ